MSDDVGTLLALAVALLLISATAVAFSAVDAVELVY
jgi:hypothetical protein